MNDYNTIVQYNTDTVPGQVHEQIDSIILKCDNKDLQLNPTSKSTKFKTKRLVPKLA